MPDAPTAPAPVSDEAAEDRTARLVQVGLPLATLAGFLGALATVGLAGALLVLGGGVLLGAVALFWSSLRALGDDLELTDDDAGASPLLAEKTRLLRALKDLEQERAIGKLEDADFAEVASRYRDELKAILKAEDEAAAPFLAAAERLVARAEAPAAKAPAKGDDAPSTPPPTSGAPSADAPSAPGAEAAPGAARVTCPACEAANEPDARFCKGCGRALGESA